MRSIATKLILSFLLIILVAGVIFSVAGIYLIGNRIVTEAQEKVRTDLNSAREIFLGQLRHVHDVVRFTADRFSLRNALLSGRLRRATDEHGIIQNADEDTRKLIDELAKIGTREGLDVLTVTDESGTVLVRTSNLAFSRDKQAHKELVAAALDRRDPVAAVSIISAGDLARESPLLAERAYFRFIYTPKARVRTDTEETAGMVLMAAAPIFDFHDRLVGVIYGGILLNRNFDIVDKIKHTVFQNVTYKGRDIGTATIFQDDVRISTNVTNADGSRAIGTRLAEDVYLHLTKEGTPWIGRAFVVNDWYITAYEPIRDLNKAMIGTLYVGVLEQKYLDVKRRAILVFLAITITGALLSMMLSYLISRKISGPIMALATAAGEVGQGNLAVRVQAASQDELRELADSFNAMASALQERDAQLKEFTRRKIMESERLALLGQLAAAVAHELNNPLQGIVAFSLLLLEKVPSDSPMKDSLHKISVHSGRCRDIIRGLLDFARQREPYKRPININAVLQDCLSLLDGQALFHNIQIARHCQESLPVVVADPSQIQQVFMNMIINAAEAMDGSGRLTVATRFVPADNVVEVQFTDTGHGISPGDMEQIFDPFFTTKDIGHGTGLGLAISYGIVREHQGTISVESEVGRGTTFVVRLPVNGRQDGQNG
mgnify:CR=1 FL=1